MTQKKITAARADNILGDWLHGVVTVKRERDFDPDTLQFSAMYLYANSKFFSWIKPIFFDNAVSGPSMGHAIQGPPLAFFTDGDETLLVEAPGQSLRIVRWDALDLDDPVVEPLARFSASMDRFGHQGAREDLRGNFAIS